MGGLAGRERPGLARWPRGLAPQPGPGARRLASRARAIWLVPARPGCRCSGLELSCFCVLIAEPRLEQSSPHILCLLTISAHRKQTPAVRANPLVKWEGNRALRGGGGVAQKEAEPRGRCASRSGLRAGARGGPGGLVAPRGGSDAPPGVAPAAFLWASSASVLPLPTAGPRGDSPRHCDSRCFLGRTVSASGSLPTPSSDTACCPLLAATPESPPPVSEAGSPPHASVRLPPAGRRAADT